MHTTHDIKNLLDIQDQNLPHYAAAHGDASQPSFYSKKQRFIAQDTMISVCSVQRFIQAYANECLKPTNRLPENLSFDESTANPSHEWF